MKKTFCSILVGMVFVGAVSAAPSPQDRRALCEKHPDKYVWVDKTQACIPVDPCSRLSNAYNSAMGAYCIEVGVDGSEMDEDLEFICKASLEKRQGAKVTRKGDFAREGVQTYFMADGMYMACRFVPSSECSEAIHSRIDDAYRKACSEFGGIFKEYSNGKGACVDVSSRSVCEDIADKISLYSGCYTFLDRFFMDENEYDVNDCHLFTDWKTCAD